MSIEYRFSGKWEDYNELLRKFSLDSILKCANEASVDLCFGTETNHSHQMILMPFSAKGSGVWEKKPLLITTWNLINLSYYAIISTNDYRGDKIRNKEDFFAICAANLNYMQATERNTVESIAQSPEFLFYVWGFAGEQFKMQHPSHIFENAARELYILLEISKRTGEIDIPDIIRRKTGVEWFEITASILLIWFCFSRTFDIRNMEKIVIWDEKFRLESFRKVMDKYSTDYSEVRQSPLGRQMFYTKPYIRTQRGELLSINCYLNLCLYEHCIFWIVREYFMDIDSFRFTIYFGDLFEKYLLELFSYCLTEKEYTRIQRVKNKKRADWKMELLGHNFLIEQKSSLLRLAAKQQESDYSATSEFVSNNIIKALKQLEATERDFSDGEYIKIVLLYEDYLPSSILDHVFSLPECTVNNDNRYWLMTIDDMERFLYTYKTSPSIIQRILEEKKKVESGTAPKSIAHLLDVYGIKTNQYLQQEKFKYYKNYTQQFIKRHLVASE